jgi:hypothetical protein
VPKRVGVLVSVMNCNLLNEYVGGYTDCTNTHGMTNIKFANARQANAVYEHKNAKEKLCKTNAAVWLNKRAV